MAHSLLLCKNIENRKGFLAIDAITAILVIMILLICFLSAYHTFNKTTDSINLNDALLTAASTDMETIYDKDWSVLNNTTSTLSDGTSVSYRIEDTSYGTLKLTADYTKGGEKDEFFIEKYKK